MMWKMFILFMPMVCILAGCFYIGKDTYEDILQKRSEQWSSRDAPTVIATPMTHNLFDRDSPNIKVLATPYYPSVVLAIERNAQRLNHGTEVEFRDNTEQLLLEDAGMYIDWTGERFVDGRGNFVRSPLQFDSLLFLITIENKSWPCNIPVIVTAFPDPRNQGSMGYQAPIMSAADYPCYTPSITDLEKRIFLLNDHGDTLKPRYVWGRHRSILTLPETLFAMFPLKRDGVHHFLENSNEMFLLLTGFDSRVMLRFPLSMMR